MNMLYIMVQTLLLGSLYLNGAEGTNVARLKIKKSIIDYTFINDATKISHAEVAAFSDSNHKVLEQFKRFADHITTLYEQEKIRKDEFADIFKALNFAAKKHGSEGREEKKQTRKDKDKTPYIIHPIGVAINIIEFGKVEDTSQIIAALLHDTVEDTNTTPEEITQYFGNRVAQIVQEVTDDKSLSKEERKRLQIVNANHKSKAAATIKLGDTLYNLTDLSNNPPADWSKNRIAEYFTWTQQVINGLKVDNPGLRNAVSTVTKNFWDKQKNS